MLDTLELVKMHFSKNGESGSIEQDEGGMYTITLGTFTYYFSYDHFQIMKQAMDQFTINKRVIDFDNIEEDVPF